MNKDPKEIDGNLSVDAGLNIICKKIKKKTSSITGLEKSKIVLLSLLKSVLLPFGLSAGMSITDAAIIKESHGSGTIALIFLSEEMGDIMKIVKSLEEWQLLMKAVSETIKNGAKTIKRRISFNVIRNFSC